MTILYKMNKWGSARLLQPINSIYLLGLPSKVTAYLITVIMADNSSRVVRGVSNNKCFSVILLTWVKLKGVDLRGRTQIMGKFFTRSQFFLIFVKIFFL
nr:hypothetical protein A132_09420 [Vibrio kanaloae 5S-149]